jgi:hypothetical protein
MIFNQEVSETGDTLGRSSRGLHGVVKLNRGYGHLRDVVIVWLLAELLSRTLLSSDTM